MVQLKGKPGVLNDALDWDNAKSDIKIDVFDAFGKQIAASPVRGKGAKHKTLLTQIDKPGTYLRSRRPRRRKTDGTRLHDGGEVGGAAAGVPPPPPPPPRGAGAAEERAAKHRRHEPREPREPHAKPAGETVQARVVSAYREGGGLKLQIDKGSAAGIQPRLTRAWCSRARPAKIRSTAATSRVVQVHRRQQVRRQSLAAIDRQEHPRGDHAEQDRQMRE